VFDEGSERKGVAKRFLVNLACDDLGFVARVE